jgi:hypothetical protein
MRRLPQPTYLSADATRLALQRAGTPIRQIDVGLVGRITHASLAVWRQDFLKWTQGESAARCAARAVCSHPYV